MKTGFVGYILILGITGLLDGLWLTFMTPRFYRPVMSHLLSDTLNFKAAVFFYLLYGFGILALVVLPALQNATRLNQVALFAAIFGLVAYGTYDLTNHATLKNWPWTVTLVDMAWGTFLTCVAATLAVILLRYLAR